MPGICDGRVVIVTGAGRGLGRAHALELARQGAKVVVNDLGTSLDGTGSGSGPAGEVVEEIRTAGGEAIANGDDVADWEGAARMVASAVEAFGDLHAVVNNAGFVRDRMFANVAEDEWDAVIDTNLKSVFRLSRAVLRSMMKARTGRIINITSVVGSSGNPGQVNYAATKAGVAGMTRSLAREIGSRGITVNCVAPGFIDTDMTKDLPAEQQAALKQQIPLGRLGSPDDIAHAVAFLASPQAGYITGTTLHVNGGMYMS